MNPETHKRFLEYRERHGYFATAGQPMLRAEQFARLDAEHVALEEKGDDRDDEEEARFAELTRLLFRD
jgi:hypothetical protein